jgi:heme-degrading monooxygenase HmoA
MDYTDPKGRTAGGAESHEGRVTLINSFVVPEGRDDDFMELWTETSRYFRAQPGFVSLQLHRAVSADAPHRFVNVAVWESFDRYRAPHQTDEFRRLVTQEAWREFPSSPALYEVALEHRLEPSRG